VQHYEGHARSLAKRFYRQREPLEDLQQVALEALLLALQRFDPEHKKPFFGFANPTIIGSLRRHYRDIGWSVRVPRRVHDLASTMRDATELLNQDLGRPPTTDELADLMGISEAEVDQAQAAMAARSTDSLDAPLGERDPADVFGGEDKNLGLAENWVAVQQVLAILPDEDRTILQLYFVDELTQTEIAERTGVSQMHVSRALSRILRQMRSHLPTD
jgi:RNA polymerase sigma-B factor